MEFERQHKVLLKNRLINESRRFIQVIYGPRQVGKTTMVTQLVREIEMPVQFVSADGVASLSHVWIEQQWEAARLALKQLGAKEGFLIFDEIQKIRNWSETVKKEWDADTRNAICLKVVLMGSSRLLLQQGLTESLAGRFETIYMGHWSFLEMKEAFGFDVNQYIWFGGYPGAAQLVNDEERWKQYVSDSLIETSISKDILMLTRIDKPALLKRLFELGCKYSGQILSYTKILGQLLDAGNTTTLAHYLKLLDNSGLLGGVEKYSAEKIRQRNSSPKFQVYNTALISAQVETNFEETFHRPDLWGRWVESAIGAHLLNGSLVYGYQLYYWREKNNEIDFVLQHKGKIIGIEVKSGNKTRISGAESFKKQFNPHKIYLAGMSGIPLSDFLLVNPVDLF